MNFKGVDLHTRIMSQDIDVDACNVDGKSICILYSNADGHTHEVANGQSAVANAGPTKHTNLYKLELSNGTSIEVTSACKFLCNVDLELKWFSLFDIPVDALIVTANGSYNGSIMSKRESHAICVNVPIYNSFVANGFVISNAD